MDLHLRDLRYFVVTEIRKLGGTEVICTEDEDLAARVNEIAGTRSVRKALDCVAGQLGADVFQALAPQGELVVYRALATHRQTDPSARTIPLFARSVIYDAKSLRGFWLFHWVVTTPPEQVAVTLTETRKLVTHGILKIPRVSPYPSSTSPTPWRSLKHRPTAPSRSWSSPIPRHSRFDGRVGSPAVAARRNDG